MQTIADLQKENRLNMYSSKIKQSATVKHMLIFNMEKLRKGSETSKNEPERYSYIPSVAGPTPLKDTYGLIPSDMTIVLRNKSLINHMEHHFPPDLSKCIFPPL